MNYKIFSAEKNAFWRQDQYGYTDEPNAGFWNLSEIDKMTLDDEQLLVPYEPSESESELRPSAFSMKVSQLLAHLQNDKERD
ncbi:hypothetical protein PSI23_15880 [Xenorhabdus sp. XENO-10]|uniref:Uncharacterized protein n=1 Tax=Xenorhabdus yunnanensis TaxID=3025878 RepID=A0ABT5LIE0_9GAMM|nr:hypothetical protein [Xenorhabdus yunnanensis]MDC9590724.1 hypothetical protein [Xenorhabdus yunnanensis]